MGRTRTELFVKYSDANKPVDVLASDQVPLNIITVQSGTTLIGGSTPTTQQKASFSNAMGIPTVTGANGLTSIVNVATYAAALAVTTKSLIFVIADETNDNLPTMYFYDGTTLNWLPSVGV